MLDEETEQHLKDMLDDTRKVTSFKVDEPRGVKEKKEKPRKRNQMFDNKRNLALKKWLDEHTDEEIRDVLLAHGNYKEVAKELHVPRTVVVDVRRGLNGRIKRVVKKFKLPECTIWGGKPAPTRELFVNSKFVYLLFKIHDNGFQEVIAVFRTETSAEKYREQYMFNTRHQFVYDKEKIYLKHPIVAYPVKRQRMR